MDLLSLSLPAYFKFCFSSAFPSLYWISFPYHAFMSSSYFIVYLCSLEIYLGVYSYPLSRIWTNLFPVLFFFLTLTESLSGIHLPIYFSGIGRFCRSYAGLAFSCCLCLYNGTCTSSLLFHWLNFKKLFLSPLSGRVCDI